MTRYRKKPVVVEAWQFKGIPNKEGPPPRWLMAALNSAFGDGPKVPGTTLCVGGVVSNYREQRLDIGTLEGVVRASAGDWIIKGIKDELYPCKPDIFAATYEEADDAPENARLSTERPAGTPPPSSDRPEGRKES